MNTLNSIIQVLQLNSTLFVYLILFAGLIFIVSKMLIAPYYKLFEMQHSHTQGQIQKAQDMQKENDQLQAEYEKLLIQFNDRFQHALQMKKNKIVKQQEVLFNKAQKKARILIQNAQKNIQKEFQIAEQQLKHQTVHLARLLSDKLVQ